MDQKIKQLKEEPLEENLKEAIGLLKSNQESNLIIEQMYYNTAKNIGQRLDVSSYDQLANKLVELGLGQARVSLISEDEIIIRLFECLTCSDVGYIGKSICFFEAGIIAGAVSSILGYSVEAVEEECQGLGGDYCEFKVAKDESQQELPQESDKDQINMVNLTLHSLNLAKQYKEAEYKTEFFSNTNQKLDEAIKNIHQINQFNETVLDSIPNCLAVIDSNGVITKINKEYQNLAKLKAEEILNKSINSLNWQSKYQEVLKTKQTAVWKESQLDKEYIVFETPIKDGNGVIRQLIPVKSDFMKLLLDKIDFLEKEMKYYKNKANQQQKEERLLDNTVVASAKMKETIKYIKKVAKTDATVLLRGESGTGKTTFAKKIHGLSLRKHNSFVYIDCTTIPNNFFEAELFGYEPGAFTGARKEGKIGKLATADGGTVFLDEISEIPAQMQAKLLRFIQEQKFERIGSTETQKVDTRIIAASNQDLEQMVKQGSFRKDLYYRLNVVNITLPPLRERWEDIPCLVDKILLKFGKDVGIDIKRVSEAGLKELMDYDWPGNIRELENFLQRLSITAEDDLIKQDEIVKALAESKKLTENPAQVEDTQIDQLEKELIIKKLKQNNNKTQVAKELGISRQTLYNKLDKYGIKL